MWEEREVHLPAEVASLAVCASSKSNDTIVLSEGRHRRDGCKGSEKTVQTICKDTTLDSGIENGTIDLEIRY
jgi:hypothetical protein